MVIELLINQCSACYLLFCVVVWVIVNKKKGCSSFAYVWNKKSLSLNVFSTIEDVWRRTNWYA